MKKYFINLDVHNLDVHSTVINKFVAGIVVADINSEKLIDIARRFCKELTGEVKNLTINIISFNNIY